MPYPASHESNRARLKSIADELDTLLQRHLLNGDTLPRRLTNSVAQLVGELGAVAIELDGAGELSRDEWHSVHGIYDAACGEGSWSTWAKAYTSVRTQGGGTPSLGVGRLTENPKHISQFWHELKNLGSNGRSQVQANGTLSGVTGPKNESRKKPNGGRGRRSDTDHKEDQRLFDSWKSNQFKTYQECASANSIKERDLMLAIDRHEKRLSKQKCQGN